MGTNLQPLPADLSSLTVAETRDAKRSREALMETIVAQAGDTMDLARVTAVSGGPDAVIRTMQQTNGELARIDQHVDQAGVGLVGEDGHLHPFPHPGGGRTGHHSRAPGRPSVTPGWRAGYWSQPFMQASTGTLTPSGSVTLPSLTPGLIQIADRPTSILDLVPVLRLTGTDQYSYLKETVRTNKAAPVVSSGTAVGTKPTSTYSVIRVDAAVQWIAHISQQIGRGTLADAGLLATYIDGSLREGVLLALENQIVNGNGSPPNLQGFTTASGINTTVTYSSNILTTARKALTQLNLSYIYGAVYVFSPNDWEKVETLNTADGEFILGQPGQLPVDQVAQRLWSQPVVVSTAVPDGYAYLVDFAGSTALYERENVVVDWSENIYDSTAGVTDFARNLIRFRAEGRWGFAVLRPAGVIKFPTA